jgi:hypothetical protein
MLCDCFDADTIDAESYGGVLGTVSRYGKQGNLGNYEIGLDGSLNRVKLGLYSTYYP